MIQISSIIKTYCDTLDKKILENQSNIQKYTDDIPLEFLDPIMSTPINTPVELPDSKVVIDLDTITNHLVFSESDPFNRCPLTLDSLMKYNDSDETKNNISNFLNNFKEWKNRHTL